MVGSPCHRSDQNIKQQGVNVAKNLNSKHQIGAKHPEGVNSKQTLMLENKNFQNKKVLNFEI
jgi:hypothetical protein